MPFDREELELIVRALRGVHAPDQKELKRCLIAKLQIALSEGTSGRRSSIECPYCHEGFGPEIIDRHITEKH